MTLSPSIPHARRAAGTLASLALATLVAACGGGATPSDGVVSLVDPSSTTGPSATPAASLDPEEAMQAFTACMHDHGVDVQVSAVEGPGGKGGVQVNGGGPVSGGKGGPGGEAQPGGTPPPADAMAKANEACRHLLPAGGRGDPNATMDPALAEKLLAFSQCMRDHGIDFPDPVFSGGGVSISIGGPDGKDGLDPTSDKFQAAQEACGSELPGGNKFQVGTGPTESKP